MRGFYPQADGSILVDGAAPIREVKAALSWDIPDCDAQAGQIIMCKVLQQDHLDKGVAIKMRGFCSSLSPVSRTSRNMQSKTESFAMDRVEELQFWGASC